MTYRDFCYWLQGYFEITEASSNRAAEGLTPGQVETIRRHLAMVTIHEGGDLTQAAPQTPSKTHTTLIRC